jgi:hypothetical protein
VLAQIVQDRACHVKKTPRVVWDKFKLWRGAVKNRGKWTLDAIAESVFVISRHVHDREEKMIKNGGGVFVDSRIEALVLMYKFFLMEINLAEEVRQSQNRAAAMSLSSRQQRPTNPSKPLPPNLDDHQKLGLPGKHFHWDVPGCGVEIDSGRKALPQTRLSLLVCRYLFIFNSIELV